MYMYIFRYIYNIDTSKPHRYSPRYHFGEQISFSPRGFANSRFRRVMNDVIGLPVRNVPAHFASRSSNSRRGLLFSPRPTLSVLLPSPSPPRRLRGSAYLRNERRPLLRSGGRRVPHSRGNSRDYSRPSPFIRCRPC